MRSSKSITAIIVTHDSELFIEKCVQAIPKEVPVVIIDSGSKDLSCLGINAFKPRCQVIIGGKEIGFCKANNIGYQAINDACEYLLFLNPDAFLTPTWIEQALQTMEKYPQCGALGGILEGYDMTTDKPTGHYDSVGIFRTFYGRWYDRFQGKPLNNKIKDIEEVPALCAALLLCRREALESVLIRGREVFDESFYMYKEDIDLSLRLKQAGWQILLDPSLHAYHCRGWKKRREIPRYLRLFSARNELKIHSRQFSFCTIYSLIKYIGVFLFNI